MNLGPAKFTDLEAIVEIYNWAIINTTATFDTEEKSVEDQVAWFESHNEKFPLLVMRSSQGVLGWGSISKWSERKAYDRTGEIALYIHPDHQQQGIGSEILKELIIRAQTACFLTLVSKITVESKASIYLHEKYGFEIIGTMKKVGVKFDRVLDVHLMQMLV